MIAPEFERVEEVFRAGAAQRPTGGLAFAATLNGEPIIDLVSGEQEPGVPWTSDTRVGVASITKGWATMCLQVLFDRGEFNLDMRVADVWPEFGTNGKENITMRHIVDHTAGLLGVGDVASLLQWDGGGWDDLDAIAERLASTRPAWEPGSRCGYHAVTFGWLAGEIVRRIDGRTLGTFFHDEIAAPLNVRCQIGVPRAEQGDIAKSIQSPELIEGPFFLKPILKSLPGKLRDPNQLAGMAFLGDGTLSIMDSIDNLMADGRWVEAEVPASNGVTSAKDLARLYAPLANGGSLDGVRVFEQKSMDVFLAPGGTFTDSVMGDLTNIPILKQLIQRMATVTRSVGGYGINAKKMTGPNPLGIESGGAGGQMVFADQERHVTGAFVRSAMSANNDTQKELVKALFESLEKSR